MTDIVCPLWGHRALSAATRCPRCGQEFPTELIQRPVLPPARPWLRPAVVAVGGAAVVVALALLSDSRGAPRDAAPAAAAVVVPAPVASQGPDTGATDTTSLAPTAPVPVASPRATEPPPVGLGAGESPSSGTALRRYATTWVNVRLSRGLEAAEVRVLNPGESVLVDSLIRGWYRVVANGRTLGYAHRRFLAAAPPETPSP